MCRCRSAGGGAGGQPHPLGGSGCDYPRPRSAEIGGAVGTTVGSAAYARHVPKATETVLAPLLGEPTIGDIIIAGSSGELGDVERAQMNRNYDDVKQDYQRRVIQQSNQLALLTDELLIQKDINKKLMRMIEELIEREDLEDIDPTIYRRQLDRLQGK